MERTELEHLISRYMISDNRDGKLRIGFRPDAHDPELIRDHKAELMQILQERDAKMQAVMAKQDALDKKRRETVEAIPGFLELREAIRKENAYTDAFNLAMERGDGVYPSPPEGPSSTEIAKQYPAAAFALDVDSRRYYTNYELSVIAWKAYNALGDGKDWKVVESEFNQAKEAFVERHF